MAINFPSNPSNGQTHSGFTYNSSVGAWESTASTPVTQATLDGYLQVANVSSTTTVYTALSDLPMSGNDTGAQAYVSGTNRLYLWNGTGWYNIALINTNPTISGASATYDLNTDGSNTVVTLVATDPEGLPITFTASHTGLGVGANAIATVTQSNNIFTFTPTTNTALAGTFTTTFTASDGVNLAGANSSFTLAFSLNNSNYTTALITSVGDNNAVNDSFVDSSPDNRTLTGYGGAHLTTFSPYRQAGYSTYFDGSGDYLQLSASNDWGFGTGAWTIEFWLNTTDTDADVIAAFNASSPYAGWSIRIENGLVKVFVSDGSSNEDFSTVSGTTIVNDNVWHHVVVTSAASSNTVSCYVDGVLAGSNAFSIAISSTGQILRVGADTNSSPSRPLAGYLTDVRIVKGTQVYTSAFTPPTTRLTAITNTSLLTCHLPYLEDDSTSDHTIGVAGNVSTQPFTPYEHTIYTDTDDGGSIKLSASGDYVGFSNSTDFDFTGDFTIAAWVYRTGSTGYDSIIAITDAGNDGLCSIGTDRLLLRTSGGGAIVDNSSYTIPTNRWTHVALTRSGSDIKLFLNGTVAVSATSSSTISENNLNIEGRIGSRVNSANIGYFYANIADLYVKNGTADYTAEFTPPLTPASSTGTILHVKGTGAGIIDKSQSVKSLTLNGDVKSSTTQTKYLTSSMYFDGTGDCISTSDSAELGTGDFTLEAWIYPTALNANDAIIAEHWSGTTAGFIFRIFTSNYLSLFDGTTNRTSSTAIVTNQWQHVAASRESGTLKLFINGTQVLSVATSSSLTGPGSGESVTVGALTTSSGFGSTFTGYISDARITKGLARYTANFTPPTAALQG
jgi:hypothetical protein